MHRKGRPHSFGILLYLTVAIGKIRAETFYHFQILINLIEQLELTVKQLGTVMKLLKGLPVRLRTS